MNEILNEHFNILVDRRINQVGKNLINDVSYQEQQHILYGMDDIPDIALEVHEVLQSIAKKHAYKQGFIDGLSFMAELGA